MILKLEKVIVDPKIEIHIDEKDSECPFGIYIGGRLVMWMTKVEAELLVSKLALAMEEAEKDV